MVFAFVEKWWVWVDSNHRPHPYQGCALTKLSYRPTFVERAYYNKFSILVNKTYIKKGPIGPFSTLQFKNHISIPCSYFYLVPWRGLARHQLSFYLEPKPNSNSFHLLDFLWQTLLLGFEISGNFHKGHMWSDQIKWVKEYIRFFRNLGASYHGYLL